MIPEPHGLDDEHAARAFQAVLGRVFATPLRRRPGRAVFVTGNHDDEGALHHPDCDGLARRITERATDTAPSDQVIVNVSNAIARRATLSRQRPRREGRPTLAALDFGTSAHRDERGGHRHLKLTRSDERLRPLLLKAFVTTFRPSGVSSARVRVILPNA